MPHLSHSFSGALRTFSFWIANGSVGHPLLEGVDYACILREPSALEQVYAIFANVIEVDESGRVINAEYAERTKDLPFLDLFEESTPETRKIAEEYISSARDALRLLKPTRKQRRKT